ncbi:MAG: hypothetical protein ACXADY_23600 [Candidatus Hodarchaeales archaeon]|jgi:hypothetical protein
MIEASEIDFSSIWGNLRNIIDFSKFEIPGKIKIIGSVKGEFPVDSYNSCFLEIPLGKAKFNLDGRRNYLQVKHNQVHWKEIRIIHLPIYISPTKETPTTEILRAMFKHWKIDLIPEEIPCMAIALKTDGFYTEWREGQLVIVLVIWFDHSCKILELDWYEGAEDDCITPEWYLRSSDLLSLEESLLKLKNLGKNAPKWGNQRYSILLNPSCIGGGLKAKIINRDSDTWGKEWQYYNKDTFLLDLGIILKKTRSIFFT